MRRREFVLALGGVTAAWPLVASAQQSARLPTIGFIGPSTAAADATRRAALKQRLAELGWVEGRTMAIEYRWAEGSVPRAGEIAAEYVRQGVDVIVVSGDAQVRAVEKATSTIPIVIAAAADPVGNGLVQSLARPGGNATGLSRQLTDSTGKRLELLRDIMPALKRVAILFQRRQPAHRPGAGKGGSGGAHARCRDHQGGGPPCRRYPARDRTGARSRRCALCLHRSVRQHQRRAYQFTGAGSKAAYDAQLTRQTSKPAA